MTRNRVKPLRARANHLKALLLLCAVLAAASLAACGGSSDNSSTENSGSATEEATVNDAPGNGGVDVGTGEPIPITDVASLKIAYVAPALSTGSSQRERDGVVKTAEEHGISVKVFDPQFDPARQFSLYQNVVESGEYDALLTVPLDGAQSCEILSKTAPSQGMVVSVLNLPICGTEFASAKGDGLWTPGTLDTVGVAASVEGLGDWAKTCAKETGGGEAILINGAAGTANFKVMSEVFNETDMDIVGNYATLYDTAEALEKTSAALTAHPDLKVVASQAPVLTQGVMQALKNAGKTPGKDVKVCSFNGGTQELIDWVKAGEVAVDSYANNEWIGMAGVQSIIDAVEGKQIPRVIVPGDNGKIEKSGLKEWPPNYTKESADQFTPTGA